MKPLFPILASLLILTGCSDGMKKTFGLEANPPDAFDVATQAPLSLPPELGQLPPPNPGEPRPQPDDAAQAGLDALSPESALTPAPTGSSPGEQALLDQAGPPPPAEIRAQGNQSALIASRHRGRRRRIQTPAGKRRYGPTRHRRRHPPARQHPPEPVSALHEPVLTPGILQLLNNQ